MKNTVRFLFLRFAIVGSVTGIVGRCARTDTDSYLAARFIGNVAPFVDNILVSQYNTLVLTFSEKVDNNLATQAGNYQIVSAAGASLKVNSVSEVGGSGITFQVITGVQQANIEYALSVTSIKSLRGFTVDSQRAKKFIGYNSGGSGVFVDNGNGTVYASGLDVTWAKCPQDNSGAATLYSTALNNCTGGSGTIGTFAFCSAADNSCNGGVSGQNLDGSGTSAAWNTCAALNSGSGFAGRKTWRVAGYTELLSLVVMGPSPTINGTLFPSNGATAYWSTASSTLSAVVAYQVHFATGVGQTATKTTVSNVRCLSPGS